MQNRNLLNFRIANSLKYQFQETCRDMQTSMTAELNRMIRKFVHEQMESSEHARPIKWFSSNDWGQ